MYIKARELYEQRGIDTETVLEKCTGILVFLHCWQGDDVCGFEKGASGSSGGIQTTGNYPDRANNKAELTANVGLCSVLFRARNASTSTLSTQ
jgi:L-rhamnose isomerase